MKKVILAVALAMALAGCGGGHKVAYRPIAYGENNQCYYVNSPAETQMLMDQGLCDRSWAPTIMPSYWHQRYYPYYASPAYYNAYVPVPVRTVYVQSERSWGSSNKSAIATATKEATYQGSNGKTVPASKIGATKYGAGNRFGKPGAKFGGGSRNATTPKPAPGIPSSETKTSPAPPQAPTAKTPAPKAQTPAPKSTPSKPSGGSKSSGGTKSGGGYKSGGGGSKSYGGGSRSGGGYSGGGRSFGGGRR